MARLSQTDVKRIETMVYDWRSSKLNWDLVVAACENELGIITTRQALNRRENVKMALKARKAELKAPSQSSRKFSDIDQANDRIARLTQRVAELEQAQEMLVEQFARWAFNAKAHGMTKNLLDQPIPNFNLG